MTGRGFVPDEHRNDIRVVYDRRAELPFRDETYGEDVATDVAILVKLNSDPDAYLCDVGCGRGHHMRRLREIGFKNLWGIDLSARSLDPCLDHVLCGDVTRWGIRGFFDLTYSFLACIGAGSVEDDLAYLQAMCSISRPRATVVLSCFCVELADSLVGQYSVKYDISSPVVVNSTVGYDPTTRRLIIQQSMVEDGIAGHIPSEELTLRTRTQLMQMAEDSGLMEIASFMPGDIVADGQALSTKGRILIVGRNGV